MPYRQNYYFKILTKTLRSIVTQINNSISKKSQTRTVTDTRAFEYKMDITRVSLRFLLLYVNDTRE